MDDYGDLEGWYVTSALGYLQVDLASEYYEIGSPLFSKVTVKLPGKRPGDFTIRANHVSDSNKYIQSAKLNGKPLNVPLFRQADMIPGGSLVFEMGPAPNLSWGIATPGAFPDVKTMTSASNGFQSKQ
jgi:putative alpha-1,2-mannosidase